MLQLRYCFLYTFTLVVTPFPSPLTNAHGDMHECIGFTSMSTTTLHSYSVNNNHCTRLVFISPRLVCRRLTNFETTDRYGIMPSLRRLRAVEERRGDLKQHGACHDKVPTLGLQNGTVTAHRLAAVPHQISNSLVVSFLTNKFLEIHVTRTRQKSFCSSPFTHWLTTFVRSFMYTTPTCCVSIYFYLANCFRALLHYWSCMGVESRSHESSVRLEAVHPWCGQLALHLLRPRGLASLDYWGDGLAHRQPLITAKVASRGEHPTKGRDMPPMENTHMLP